jgi:ABC-type transporter Mla MlaB component
METVAKKAALALRQEKDTIFVTGDVTRETAPQLVQLLTEDKIYTLDFAGVERINFGGQRVLLHASQTGKKFNIVNAGVKVRAALSSTGWTLLSAC